MSHKIAVDSFCKNVKYTTKLKQNIYIDLICRIYKILALYRLSAIEYPLRSMNFIINGNTGTIKYRRFQKKENVTHV